MEPEFFEEMVETVGVGVAIYGSDGTYKYVNQAYADLLEADRESLVGTPLWEINPAIERERFDDYWASFVDGETRTDETTHRYDGTTVPVVTNTTRRRIDGTAYHFGTIRDISERKARERELERQNERLDSFARIVSHDLRNPLNVAQGYLESAQDDVDRDELQLVASALTRMDILIDDLLTLARKGQTIDEPTEISLGDVASAAWMMVESDQAELQVDSDRSLEGDQTRVVQLFENLFRNAVEHGSDDVTVRVGWLSDTGGFYVADDGPGLSDHRTIFEPGVTTTEGGTGFGLAIVSEIADAHGWDSRAVDSEAGGARFEFRFGTNEDSR